MFNPIRGLFSRGRRQRGAGRGSAGVRLLCEALESRCLLSAIAAPMDDLQGMSAAIAAVRQLPVLSGGDVLRMVGPGYSPILPTGPLASRGPWARVPHGQLDYLPGAPLAEAPDRDLPAADGDFGGYMDLDETRPPPASLASPAIEHEVREVERMLSALLFVPPEPSANLPASSGKLLEEAVDALLAAEEQERGRGFPLPAEHDGGMVRLERPAIALANSGSPSQSFDIEALLDSPVKMEASYARFQVFEVSARGEVAVDEPAVGASVRSSAEPRLPVQEMPHDGSSSASAAAPPKQPPGENGATPDDSLTDGPAMPSLKTFERTPAFDSSIKSAAAAVIGLLMFRRMRRTPTKRDAQTVDRGPPVGGGERLM